MKFKTHRSPRTLRSVMMVITDDFLIGEGRGYPIQDCSRRVGDPSRLFDLKFILLYVQGDYPAQRLASGFSHAGKCACHYCLDESTRNNGVSRNVYGNYYRWLPLNDQKRPDGAAKTTSPPPTRTSNETSMVALENEFVLSAKLQAAQARAHVQHVEVKESTRKNIAKTNVQGVNWWCPLTALYGFDAVWDFVFDIMHAADVFKRHIVPTMKGERAPTQPVYLVINDTFPPLEIARRKTQNDLTHKQHAKACEVTTGPTAIVDH